MSLNKIIYTAALSIILLSCKKEAVLKPETISPLHTLPQGNHAYDTRIVDFYNKNGTYILYNLTAMTLGGTLQIISRIWPRKLMKTG